MAFTGFPEGKVRLTPLPAPFFTELLPEVDSLGELKLLLYAFWRLDHMDGVFRALRREDFSGDSRFMEGLGPNRAEAETALDEALERAVLRGALLRATLMLSAGQEHLYFLNSPKGRAAVQAVQSGRWQPSRLDETPIELRLEQPNLFRLYEENIGPLTPMIADALRDAEETFPSQWIEDALRIAVENNKRSWRYVTAILDRWQTEGRDEREDRQGTEKDRRRYIEGKYSDFIEH